MSQITEELVLESLKQIIDPDLRKDIVTLGFIRDLAIEGGEVHVVAFGWRLATVSRGPGKPGVVRRTCL